jgi:hypothetical protein
MLEQFATSLRYHAYVLTITSLTCLSGCAMPDPMAVSVGGLNPAIESLNFQGVAARQDALVTELQNMAGFRGVSLAATGDPHWFIVLKAGMEFEGGQCDEYLSALFKFDRKQRALRQGLTATGAAAATILGLTHTPAAPIAITAAAFGLGASLFDADVNSVLFQLAPSGVRNIVIQAQDAYRDGVTSKPSLYQSRVDALLALQGYLRLCTPAAIEAAVNQAAATTQFTAKAPTANDPAPSLQQTSSAAAPILIGTLGEADLADFKTDLAMQQSLPPLSNKQILVMAHAMLPWWNQAATNPALTPLRASAVLSDWQTDPGHARALMFSWLSVYSGTMTPWNAALAAAISSPK